MNILYDKQKLNRNIRHLKFLTPEEKKIFDTKRISIIKITNCNKYKDKNKNDAIMERLKKNMFLRLQNGERVCETDKFRNIDKPIINALNNYNLLDYETYEKDNDNIWNILIKNLDIPKTKTQKKSKLKYIKDFLITCLLIIKKKSFDIGSYLELNIIEYIKKNQSIFNDTDNTLNFWKDKINYFKNFLIDIKKELVNKSIINILLNKHILYVLLYQYFTNKEKYLNYLKNITSIQKIYTDSGLQNKIKNKKVVEKTDFEKLIDDIDKKNTGNDSSDESSDESLNKIEVLKPTIKTSNLKKRTAKTKKD